jgi:alkylation response protein AidB-like acyl-CoA dehydrogenase
MDIFFAATQIQKLVEDIKDFLKEQVLPLEPQLLQTSFRENLPLLHRLRQEVKQKGWWAPPLPKNQGGMGLSLTDFAHLSEALGTTPFGHYLFNCQAPDIGNMELLLHYASAELQQQFALPLIKGEIRSCFSMTEPEYAGSNPTMLSTRAVRDGNEYVINGHKWFTSSADGASFAIVMAVTNPDEENRYRKASMIVVPTDTPGFRLARNISIMGEEGSDYASHSEVYYEDCRVPISNLIGQEGEGFALAQQRLGPGRIHHCMRWIGICERAFDLMCRRAAERKISSTTYLGHQQFVQQWIAESRAEIDAARLMVLKTAQGIDQQGSKAVRNDISAIKFFVADVLHKVLDRAIQVHGALGITDDLPLAYWYRHERGARIYDGPDEVHKASLARQILKKYGLKTQNND